MDPLYETTVGALVEATKSRIAELTEERDQKRQRVLQLVKLCDTFEVLQQLMATYNERENATRLKQHVDNLEYLSDCKPTRLVVLNQTEWRHYFFGSPRPELC